MEVPERIELNQKTELVLTWPDESVTEISATAARAGCTCAQCQSDDGRQAAVVAANPIGVTIEDAHLVGAYAINLVFGPDGHSTGIFDWETLRALGEGQPG